MIKAILFITVFIALANVAFSQPKEISNDESLQALVKGFQKFNEVSWRKEQKNEYFENGKLINTKEEIEEKINPDRHRILTTERKGTVVDRFEIISIGENTYCKKNKTVWKKSENCLQNYDFTSRGIEVSSKYMVEETTLNNQKVSLFRRYETFNDEDGLKYSDYKFWINEEGFLIKREMEIGLVESKKVLSRMTETTQVDPKDLKIEAPIK